MAAAATAGAGGGGVTAGPTGLAQRSERRAGDAIGVDAVGAAMAGKDSRWQDSVRAHGDSSMSIVDRRLVRSGRRDRSIRCAARSLLVLKRAPASNWTRRRFLLIEDSAAPRAFGQIPAPRGAGV